MSRQHTKLASHVHERRVQRGACGSCPSIPFPCPACSCPSLFLATGLTLDTFESSLVECQAGRGQMRATASSLQSWSWSKIGMQHAVAVLDRDQASQLTWIPSHRVAAQALSSESRDIRLVARLEGMLRSYTAWERQRSGSWQPGR